MAIYITGDTHIPIDIKKLTSEYWEDGNILQKNDYLIVCGDFGLIWKNKCDSEEIYWKNWFDNKPWTTLFLDGNHENHYRLSRLKIIKKFGGNVGYYSDHIFHLKRGEIYDINGSLFFCMGGAKSTDTIHRTEGISWWREELPSTKEINYGLDNLKKYNNTVDYILSHTLPINLISNEQIHLYGKEDNNYDPTCEFLQHIYDTVKFKHGYCGHMHINERINKYTVLYDDIIKLKE